MLYFLELGHRAMKDKQKVLKKKKKKTTVLI